MISQIIGTLFFSGLILAGSDGQYFPIANIIGAGLMLIAARMANNINPARLRRR